MSASDRDREMNVRNTHRIRDDIDDLCGLDHVAPEDVPEHAANLDFLSSGTGFEPLTNLLRKHDEYLSLVPAWHELPLPSLRQSLTTVCRLALKLQLTL